MPVLQLSEYRLTGTGIIKACDHIAATAGI